MSAWLGVSLGVGLVLLLAWIIKRDANRAVDAAMHELDAQLSKLREDALIRTQKEFDEEDKRMDSTRPADRFDWLFEEHTD